MGRTAGDEQGPDGFRHALEGFLAERLFRDWSSVEIVSITRSLGGLSWETHVVDAVDPARAGVGRRVVVKRPPLDGPLAPYDLKREGVLLDALLDSQVPVARLLEYSAEPELCGRQVEVSEFVEGDIPELGLIEQWEAWRDERRRRAVTEALIGVLAALQDFDWRTPALPAVLDGRARPLGKAGGAVATGLNHVVLPAGGGGAPAHCHSLEEELFVVLDGDGVLELWGRGAEGPEEHPLHPGDVVSRPAGTGVAHAFAPGAGGLTYLAYGTREPNDMCFYPQLGRVSLRGLGIALRSPEMEHLPEP